MRIYLKKKQAHLRTAFLLQGWKCAPSCAWIQISLCQFVEVMMANVQYSLFSQWRWVHIKILVDWPNLKVINFNLWLNPSITFWVIQPSKQPTHTHTTFLAEVVIAMYQWCFSVSETYPPVEERWCFFILNCLSTHLFNPQMSKSSKSQFL